MRHGPVVHHKEILMLTIPANDSQHHLAGRHPVTFRDRLATHSGTYGLAWSIWLTYLLVPLFIFLGTVIYFLVYTPVVNTTLGESWFVAMMVLLAAGVPLTFYARSKLFFHGYWSGRVVTPRQYIRGMVLTWTVIEAVGILSLLGCFVTGEMMPNIMPALLGFVLFITQWPNASAMTDTTGHQADSAVFRHPR